MLDSIFSIFLSLIIKISKSERTKIFFRRINLFNGVNNKLETVIREWTLNHQTINCESSSGIKIKETVNKPIA